MTGYAETIGRVMSGDYAEADEATRQEAARRLVTIGSAAAAAVTIQPLPLLDAMLISPIQIGLVQGIGHLHGYTLDSKSIIEMLGTFGASIVSQNVMIAAGKLVPFVGWAMSASMAYAITYAIGEVSHAYFASGRGLTSTQMSELFKRVYQDKRQEKRQDMKNGSLKDKITQLRDAYAAQLITEEEFERKKQELLAQL